LAIGKEYQSDEGLDALFMELTDSPDEEALMMRVVSKTRYRPSGPLVWSLAKADLELAGDDQKIVKRLIKRGFLR
jgi:hypothetical protein